MAALPPVLKEQGKWITSYDFDSRHYLKVDRWRKSWFLCRKADRKIMDLGTYDGSTGEMTSSKRESSPHYAGIEAVLKESATA